MKTAIRIKAEVWTKPGNSRDGVILHPEDGRILMVLSGENNPVVVSDDIVYLIDDYPNLTYSGGLDVEVDLSGYIPVVNPMTPQAAAMNYFFSAAVYSLADANDAPFFSRVDLVNKWIAEGHFDERTRNLIEYLLRERGAVC